MMKLFTVFSVLLVFGVPGLAQKTDNSKTSVIWSADANCDSNNSEVVKALKPQCRTVQVENMTFQIIDVGGVSYALTSRPVRDYLVASVQISNRADSPLEVSAKRARLARYKTPEDFAANVKVAYVTPESQGELRQAEYRESQVIGEKDGDIRSGLRLKDKYEESIERGKVIKKPGIQIDEPAPPPTENPAPSSITSRLRVPREIFDNVLKAKTVPVGEKAAGHLVFKNSGEEKMYLVWYLNAGQIEFVFPSVPR